MTRCVVVTSFAASSHFFAKSGLLAVTVMGLVMANQSWIRITVPRNAACHLSASS